MDVAVADVAVGDRPPVRQLRGEPGQGRVDDPAGLAAAVASPKHVDGQVPILATSAPAGCTPPLGESLAAKSSLIEILTGVHATCSGTIATNGDRSP